MEPVRINTAVNESGIVRSVRTTLTRMEKWSASIPRPVVTLAFAQSLDGCIAASQGSSTAISSVQSLFITHQLRAMHDAILVGINTVLVDDPQLTVRYADGDDPVPVILDSQLRTPPTARLLQHSKRQAVIATLTGACKQRELKLVEAGAQVIRMPEGSDGGIRLPDLFSWLREQQFLSLMIEGGSKVISSVLADYLCDQLVLTIAPRFFGQNGVRAVEKLNCVRSIPDSSLTNVAVEQIGDDLVVWGNLRVKGTGHPGE